MLPGWQSFLDNLGAFLDGEPVDLSRPEEDYSRIEVPGWSILKD